MADINNVGVKRLDVFESSCRDIVHIKREIDTKCEQGRAECRRVLAETQKELAYSQNLLRIAREREAFWRRQVEILTLGLPDTAQELARAAEELQKAIAHRIKMERRVELAQKCVSIANEMLETLNRRFNYSQSEIRDTSAKGIRRMAEADEKLTMYVTEVIPKAEKSVASSHLGEFTGLGVEYIIPNKEAGLSREHEVEAELEKKYPTSKGYQILSERYLRDKNGNIVKDLLTGEARRIDFVVVKDGKVVDSIEVTSKTAPKENQTAKEERIRSAGGNYVMDYDGNLVEFPSDIHTRIERRD